MELSEQLLKAYLYIPVLEDQSLEGLDILGEWAEKAAQLEAENEAWKRCADAFNEATAGVTIGKMAHEHERQLLEAFRQHALLTGVVSDE